MLSGDFLGINLRDFAIGTQGGFAGVYLLRKPKVRDLFSHGMVGGLAGNYVGFVLQAMIQKAALEICITISRDASSDLACFLIGICGMTLLHLAIKIVKSKTKRLVG